MKKNTKTTNVYYYQLFPSDEIFGDDPKRVFYELTDQSIFTNEANFNKVLHSDGHVNLYKIEERHNRFVLGTFVYNQTLNIPPSYNELKNEPSKLQIEDFEGLGYDSSFLYDRKTRILALESKKPGTSLKAVEDFINKNFNVKAAKFKVVVLPDEYKKFLETDEFTRIEMDLALPNNDVGIVKPGDDCSSNILEIMKDLNATTTKIIMSNGRSKKKKLESSVVKKVVNWLKTSSTSSPNVKTLRITGLDEETGQNHIFDVISNRLVTQINLDKTRIISSFQINIKYDQLEGDFLKYKVQLESLQK